MEIAEQIAPQLRGDYLERIVADLRHRCDRDGACGDGDVHKAALKAPTRGHAQRASDLRSGLTGAHCHR
jgi:hypothetical protein